MVNDLIRAPRFVAELLGVGPNDLSEKERAKEAGQCRYCGCHIKAGDFCNTEGMGQNFKNQDSLAAPRSRMNCIWCAILLKKKYMNMFQREYNLFSEERGAQSCFLFGKIHEFLMNPPKPPFVFVYATTIKAQHLIWRAKVAYDRDYFPILVGGRTLMIDRQKMMKIMPTSVRVFQRYNELLVEHGLNYKPLELDIGSVFGADVGGMIKLTKPDLGNFFPFTLNGNLHDLMVNDPSMQEDYAFLKSLNMGDLWTIACQISVQTAKRLEREKREKAEAALKPSKKKNRRSAALNSEQMMQAT